MIFEKCTLPPNVESVEPAGYVCCYFLRLSYNRPPGKETSPVMGTPENDLTYYKGQAERKHA
jgi:hypothetical protein